MEAESYLVINMALRGLLVYRNPDSTRDLNDTRSSIIQKSIFDGGTLTPSPTTLSVSIAPFKAMSNDGLVVTSDAVENLSIPSGQVSYLICFARYGIPDSTVQLQVVSEVTWQTSANRNFFITFARLDVPIGATFVDLSYVEYDDSDYSDKLGKSPWRSTVADFASLPIVGNKNGDVRLTLDTSTLYSWDSSVGTWLPIGGALELSNSLEISAVGFNLLNKATSGSGLLSGFNNDWDGFDGGRNHHGSGRSAKGIGYVEQNAIANRIDLRPNHFLINGHLVRIPYTQVILTAPPGAGFRYDLVWLEVWRETITVPSSESWANDPSLGGTSTISQLRTRLESLVEGASTPNTGFGNIEVANPSTGTYYVTRWAVRSEASISGTVIQDSSSVATSVNNIDGNPYSIPSAESDQRLWRATAPSASNNVSWAIPLLVVRRSNLESGPTSYIQEYRVDVSGLRHIFDICPRTDSGMGLKHVSDVLEESWDPNRRSGFVSGAKDPLVFSPGFLDLPPFELSFFGSLRLSSRVTSTISTGTPPASPLARMDMVVMEIVRSYSGPLYSSPVAVTTEIVRVPRHGLRECTWSARLVFYSGVTSNDLDENMQALGYSKSAPGTWIRSPSGIEDDGTGAPICAIPISIFHRRNTGVYDATTNPNGFDRSLVPSIPAIPSNPATLVVDGEFVDLRHSIIDSNEIDKITFDSFDLLLRGELKTELKENLLNPGIFGTSHFMQSRISGGAPVPGIYQIPQSPNFMRTVWSDSDEIQPMCWTFSNTSAVQNDGSVGWAGVPCFSWNGGGMTGVLSVRTPVDTVLSIFDRLGELGGVSSPNDSPVLVHEPGSLVYGDLQLPQSWSITPTSFNADGTVIAATITFTLPAGFTPANTRVYATLWTRRPASTATTYTGNIGLPAIPKKIYGAILSGDPISVGPIRRRIPVTFTPDAGGNFVTITNVQVHALYPELGITDTNTRLYGVEKIYSSSNVPIDVRFVSLTDSSGINPGFEQIRIQCNTGSNPTTAYVDVMCSGDLLNRWIEVVPESKQIRGPYCYTYSICDTQNVSRGAAPATAFHGLSDPRMQCVPWYDTSLRPEYGVSLTTASGIVSSNNSTNSRPDVTIYGSVTGAPYDVGVNAYIMWTDFADLAAIGYASPLGVSAVLNESGNNNFYGNYSSSRSVYTATPSINTVVVAPARLPMATTSDLRIFGEYYTYQGRRSFLDTPDEIKEIQGDVLSVSDPVLYTEGTGVSHLSPRLMSIADIQGSRTGERIFNNTPLIGLSTDIGTIDSVGHIFEQRRIKPTTDILRNDGHASIFSRGSSYRAISQHVPFPSLATGQTGATPWSSDAWMSGQNIYTESIDRLKYLSAADFGYLINMISSQDSGVPVLESTLGGGGQAMFKLNIPRGAFLKSLYVSVSGSSTNDTWTFSLVNRAANGTVTNISTSIAFPSVSSHRRYDISGILGAFGTSGVSNFNELYLVVEVTDNDVQYLHSIVYGYCELSDFFAAKSVIRPSKNDFSAGSVSTKMLKAGARLEIPNSWSNTNISNAISSIFDNGARDNPSVHPRGICVNYLKSSTSGILGTDQYGPAPLADTMSGGTRLYSIPGLDFSSVELPEVFTAGTYEVHVPGNIGAPVTTNLTKVGVAGSIAYTVKNDSKDLFMGVSTGATIIIGNSTFLRLGSAFDNFRLNGFPVLEED